MRENKNRNKFSSIANRVVSHWAEEDTVRNGASFDWRRLATRRTAESERARSGRTFRFGKHGRTNGVDQLSSDQSTKIRVRHFRLTESNAFNIYCQPSCCNFFSANRLSGKHHNTSRKQCDFSTLLFIVEGAHCMHLLLGRGWLTTWLLSSYIPR